jgi:hypothetical protein
VSILARNPPKWFEIRPESREWEDFYKTRWQYDKVVRTSHGVNCSMSCSWFVYVKDGMVCWELQATDYPQINPNIPNYEPRGCQRGVSASWYLYSPLRVKYPYVRGVLWEMYREARERGLDPVEAWASIVEDPEKARRYKSARGNGGWRRVSWDEAVELIAGAVTLLYEANTSKIERNYSIAIYEASRLSGLRIDSVETLLKYRSMLLSHLETGYRETHRLYLEYNSIADRLTSLVMMLSSRARRKFGDLCLCMIRREFRKYSKIKLGVKCIHRPLYREVLDSLRGYKIQALRQIKRVL